jgi:hypothetical protein
MTKSKGRSLDLYMYKSENFLPTLEIGLDFISTLNLNLNLNLMFLGFPYLFQIHVSNDPFDLPIGIDLF